MATYSGGAGDDSHTGTGSADSIYGNGGNDVLNGGDGADRIEGGAGQDALNGDAGNDDLRGGDGDDLLNGGDGVDALSGGAGTDTAIFSGLRADHIVYADSSGRYHVLSRTPGAVEETLAGIETLRFDDGDFSAAATATYLGALIHVAGDNRQGAYPAPIWQDQAIATNGDDVLTGTGGNDVVFTGNGADQVSTGAGDDIIEARGGSVIDTDGNSGNGYAVSGGDAISAGAGNDDITAGYFTTIDGGSGVDRVHLSLENTWVPWTAHTILHTFNETGLTVDLANAAAGSVTLIAGGLADPFITLTGIEAFDIALGRGNDLVSGGSADDRLGGNRGDDELHGADGADDLQGGGGADRLHGDAGNDVVKGGETGAGFDDFTRDEIHGGAGDDSFKGGLSDLFDGGAGDDRATIWLGYATHDYVLDLDAMTSAALYSFADGADDPGDLKPDTATMGIEHISALILGSGDDSVTGHVDRFANADSVFSFAYDGLSGGGGDDSFHLIGTLGEGFTSFVNGGGGNDTIVLDGDYETLFHLGYNSVTNFETIALAAGHDYDLGTSIGFNALLIDASALGAADSLKLTIDDDTSATMEIRGGAGSDTVRMNTSLDPLQRFDLGGGADVLELKGNFAAGISFAATTIANVETLRFVHDALGNFSYALATADANLAAGRVLNVDGSALGAGFHHVETLQFDGSAEIDGSFHILGGGGDDLLKGGAGNDKLIGGGGADRLEGGLGVDWMEGGAGNDIALVDNKNDKVIEVAGGGTDTVHASIDYTLPDFVENLILAGAAIKGIGNGLANTVTGNANANFLYGGAGADALIGGLGNDTYYVEDVGDVVIEDSAAGIDTVNSSMSFALGANVERLVLTGAAAINGTGNAGANTLAGNGAANILDGGAGADVMKGVGGNDTYYVDHKDDVTKEAGGGGSDTVYAAVDYSVFGQNIESLTLTGNAIKGTGNSLANTITGNTGANFLYGGGGADTLLGGLGNDNYFVDGMDDVVTEAAGEGTDAVNSGGSYVLGANVEVLRLTGTANINGTGNTLNNTIVGNTNANVLDGGAGADTLKGGAGNDSYVVDAAGDAITELAGEGTDSVSASVSYTLATNIENLTLTGASAINGTGNTLANILYGNSAANTLAGGAGDDALHGGLGGDTLTGSIGLDSFWFETALGASNVDNMIDFTAVDDGIYLDRTIFTGIAANGALAARAFRLGAAAADADDRILYDQATGNLWYDADGTGGAAAVQFAQVTAGSAMTAADFFAVA